MLHQRQGKPAPAALQASSAQPAGPGCAGAGLRGGLFNWPLRASTNHYNTMIPPGNSQSGGQKVNKENIQGQGCDLSMAREGRVEQSLSF